ncbi:alkaline phosphatase D family protein [Ruficoccus amylovorans]|uniref:Alkaline phosphatase D family protein n=1 Tax=Ruficoccus amylovorans TaxID=1804625 RepID=A0A842HJ76_9BACT|nr:alkaline phosphatase D family protein [Ruficoccus amylovorans]MBC2596190.1 alkaline phosphatase D family protein [Ruficoccus amylovorans]
MSHRPIPVFLALLLPLLLLGTHAQAQLQSGPLVGYVDMREAALWAQTDSATLVQFAYWPEGQPDQRATTPSALTRQEDDYAVTLIAGGLQPGTKYLYELLLDGKKAALDYDTSFSTPPDYRDRTPPPDFTVALGGGNYVNDKPFDPPNRIPGDSYHIMLAIMAKNPAFMLWLGNNITLREADWGSKSGMLARYHHNRALPELQPLVASVPSVATWSTHDFGPEGADRYFLGRNHAREAFRTYWPNPQYGLDEDLGLACSVRWGDAEFFVLDDRSFRDLTPLTAERRQILGEAQARWLLQSLRKSTATFKVIVMGSPFLNPAEHPDHYTAATQERDKLLQQITWAEISGLFFVSGGKDFGELTKVVRASAPDVYEVTVGPMTGRPSEDTGELNYFRVPNTTVFERQFATLRFHGPEDARQLTTTLYNADGIEQWSRTFNRSDMGAQ